ncbi:MAG: ABC transporter ATP-binding protein [Ruminiclostridium sp.]|mgnify:CR=1 FL=1|nr:ABC transporter ATP-binding protein [Ruminiclostridium sp.]MBR4111994.1 ABC transporter ATP-binding protein [Ruminiclostridium sp.]
MSYICFKNVSKSFNRIPVVKSADFMIEKGEICGFIGRNGSGKTVIFKLMTGLLVPDEGKVIIDNENYSGKGSFFPSVGVMIETPGFIPHYSGLKNLKILNSMSHNPVPKAEICALMTRLGLDPKNRRPVRTYSLGMRQKLGIIQAVMNKPELLVLDEPMNSLDAESVNEIRKLFSELNEAGATIVIASHISEDIEALCTRIFRIENAQVTELEAKKVTV